MKRGMLKTGVLTAAVCAALIVPAQAAETVTLTYERAVELARANNTTLERLVNSYDSLNDSRGEASGVLGTEAEIDVKLSALSAIASIEGGTAAVKENQKVVEAAAELGVLSSFISVSNANSDIEYNQKEYAYQRKAVDEASIKYNLGLISRMDYNEAAMGLTSLSASLGSIRSGLEESLVTLRNLTGLESDVQVKLEYDYEYKPLAAEFDIEAYIASAKNNDPSILALKADVDAKEKAVRFWSPTSEATTYKEAEAGYQSAVRSYRDGLDSIEFNIRAQYNTVRSMEENIDVLKYEVDNARLELLKKKAELEVGSITKLAYENQALQLEKAEHELENNMRTYALVRFQLENPSLIQTAGGQ